MTDQELEDEARLQYSRILWRNPRARRRLLYAWEHSGHPHRKRFERNSDPDAYVASLVSNKWSLRTLTREISRVTWGFWDESKEKAAI